MVIALIFVPNFSEDDSNISSSLMKYFPVCMIFSDVDNSIMLRILFSFVTGYHDFLKIWNHSRILSNPFCPKSLLILFLHLYPMF